MCVSPATTSGMSAVNSGSRSVMAEDEDFASACRGLKQAAAAAAAAESAVTTAGAWWSGRNRRCMVECLARTSSPEHMLATRRAESPSSPVETPTSMRMRKVIKERIPRVPSLPESQCYSIRRDQTMTGSGSKSWHPKQVSKNIDIFPPADAQEHRGQVADHDELVHCNHPESVSCASAASTPPCSPSAAKLALTPNAALSTLAACFQASHNDDPALVAAAQLAAQLKNHAPRVDVKRTHIRPPRHVARILWASLSTP